MPKNQNKQETHPEAKSSISAKHRQITCLFCDLVGSAALSRNLDAEDFRQVILDYQQVAENSAFNFRY